MTAELDEITRTLGLGNNDGAHQAIGVPGEQIVQEGDEVAAKRPVAVRTEGLGRRSLEKVRDGNEEQS